MQNPLTGAFDELVKAVGSELKTLGFAQRGSLFRVTAEHNCGLIEFQKSVKSSKQALLFTINLAVVCGDLLESGLSEAEGAQIVDAHVRQRIGTLLPGRPDKWWEITESTNRAALIQEVSEIVVGRAVPFVESYLNTKVIIALWESGQSPGLTDVQRTRFLARLKMKNS
jgi:hypothetical protein